MVHRLPPQMKGLMNLSTALNSEMKSSRALQQVVLDESSDSSSRQVFEVSRRESSKGPALQLLLEHRRPTISSALLNLTVQEFQKPVVSLKPLEEVAESGASESWFVDQSKTTTRKIKKRRTICKLPMAAAFSKSKQKSVPFVALEGIKFKTHVERTKKTENSKKGKKKKVQEYKREKMYDIPSLERVQSHIARIKVLVGQGAHQTFDNLQKVEPKKRVVSAKMTYKSPFPALRQKRDPTEPREEYIYSLINER